MNHESDETNDGDCGRTQTASRFGESVVLAHVNAWIPCDVTAFNRRHLCVRKSSGASVTTQTIVGHNPQKVKIPCLCCADGCDNSRAHYPKKQFNCIPKDLDRRNKWLAAN